jgi:hypothetical protein
MLAPSAWRRVGMSTANNQSLRELQRRTGLAPSAPWRLFINSLHVDYEAWHDGLGFDLDALGRMTPLEQDLVRQWLRENFAHRNDIDWRELDVAAALGERELLSSLLEHPRYSVRLRATRLLAQPG